MKLIPFKNINEKDEFWGGARFIKKGTGLRRVSPDEDFFEYMLVNDLSSSDWMICTHIDKFEAGKVISHVKKTIPHSNRHTVTAKEFRRSNIINEELEQWYYHHVDFDRYWLQDLDSNVEKLNKIDFHDLPINSLRINFNYLTLEIDFEIYNEEIKDYEGWIIEFNELNNFISDKLILNHESDIEITKFEYKMTNLFEGKFTLLLGHGQPSFDLEFKCRKIKIITN